MDDTKFQISSPVFADGETIPELYTCKGRNISPPLTISGVPEGTASLALVMHDPDAPVGDFLHWTMWNLNPGLGAITEGQVPDNSQQGTNGRGQAGYMGPCPPSGTHRYIFNLYALNAQLSLSAGASRDDLMKAINNHAIVQTSLTGLFGVS